MTDYKYILKSLIDDDNIYIYGDKNIDLLDIFLLNESDKEINLRYSIKQLRRLSCLLSAIYQYGLFKWYNLCSCGCENNLINISYNNYINNDDDYEFLFLLDFIGLKMDSINISVYDIDDIYYCRFKEENPNLLNNIIYRNITRNSLCEYISSIINNINDVRYSLCKNYAYVYSITIISKLLHFRICVSSNEITFSCDNVYKHEHKHITYNIHKDLSTISRYTSDGIEDYTTIKSAIIDYYNNIVN